MAERLLERTFNALAAQADAGSTGPSAPRQRTQLDEEDELRHTGAPMDVQNAIARILLAFKDKDFFRRVSVADCYSERTNFVPAVSMSMLCGG